LAVLVIATVAVAAWLGVTMRRPARQDLHLELFPGIVYERNARVEPRPAMVHVVTVNLTTPGVQTFVTPGDASGGMDTVARTTSEFVSEFGVQIGVNGSFFEPFRSNAPWDYYPHRGDPVDVKGASISNGLRYSDDDGFPALCISAGNRAEISDMGCPDGTYQGIAGDGVFVDGGQPVAFQNTAYWTNLHPRTAVAVNETGETLWLIVVDGRQPGYSEGVSLGELAEVTVGVGAFRALNLDGGGSTTLVVAGRPGPKTLNAPIDNRIPMRQRPVANHLGIVAPRGLE
ncbi:MAG TPA: phosphodiester glycosidase family protein, partial [Ardenticatenaceae bacterium]|nr:phosphodiester glycosidase family protein [Ardenticatenaceae bacterium]